MQFHTGEILTKKHMVMILKSGKPAQWCYTNWRSGHHNHVSPAVLSAQRVLVLQPQNHGIMGRTWLLALQTRTEKLVLLWVGIVVSSDVLSYLVIKTSTLWMQTDLIGGMLYFCFIRGSNTRQGSPKEGNKECPGHRLQWRHSLPQLFQNSKSE